MSKTVAIRGRTYLPGPGRNSSGSPVQGKTMVWGEIVVTDYVVATGETVDPTDLGLTTIDYVDYKMVQLNGAVITNGTITGAQWETGTNEVHLFSDATTELVANDDAVLRFFAVGDSAHNVEALP